MLGDLLRSFAEYLQPTMGKLHAWISTIKTTSRAKPSLDDLVVKFAQSIEAHLEKQSQEEPSLEEIMIKFVQTVDVQFKAYETMMSTQQESHFKLEN